uniref:Hexose transporter family protein n=1 Tax=Rhizophora mucronata TaxID=61149 RepID=A0A2P2LZH4_RHIMU
MMTLSFLLCEMFSIHRMLYYTSPWLFQICMNLSEARDLFLNILLALLQDNLEVETSNPSWKLSFPHVIVATISSFLFGYHLAYVNFFNLFF